MKSKKTLTRAVYLLILPCIIVVSVITAFNLKTSAPANPLADSVYVADIKETQIGVLTLPENAMQATVDKRDPITESNSDHSDSSFSSANDTSSVADSSEAPIAPHPTTTRPVENAANKSDSSVAVKPDDGYSPAPQKELAISTDLTDCTVNDSIFSFTAFVVGGSGNAKLSVTHNGVPLSSDRNFSVTLQHGNNKFRLKATDIADGKKISVTQTYTVRFTPVADEQTAPKIEYINLSDGATVRGCEYNLDILAVDFEGDRIYAQGIAVSLNGNSVFYQWQSKYTSYPLYLANGTNRLDIRITDNAGRFSDFTLNVNCIALADGEEIGNVTLSVDANVLGLGYLIPPENVTIHQGDSVPELVLGFLESHGFSCEYAGDLNNSFYLTRLSKDNVSSNVNIPQELIDEIDRNGLAWKEQYDDNSIGELDFCQGSGWFFAIDDNYLNYSISQATLKDGSRLRVRFSLAYGKDIGAGYDIGNGSNFEKIW